MAMELEEPTFSSVRDLLDKIEDYNDAETLYWETRHLLDERFRIDWAAASLFAIIYRIKRRHKLTFHGNVHPFPG